MTMANNSRTIHPKSPLGVLGSFVVISRELFSKDNHLGYVWDEDPNKTRVHISVGNNENYTVRNKTPSVTLNLMNVTYNKVVLGNTAQERFDGDKKASWAVAGGMMGINIISPSQGECLQICDWMSSFLILAREDLERDFGFRELGMPAVSQPQLHFRDQKSYIATINVSIQWEVAWLRQKVASLIDSIQITVKDAGSERKLAQIALASIK